MSGFDHVMLHTKAGASVKLGRLSPAERWAWAAGVLCIAGEADRRGTLTIADGIPADERDVARKADVSVKVARGALVKLRDLGMLHTGDDGIEYVHDWDEHQPRPRHDRTAVERKRRQRERDKASREEPVTPDVTGMSRRDTRDVTPPEVEGEGEEQQQQQQARAPAAVDEVLHPRLGEVLDILSDESLSWPLDVEPMSVDRILRANVDLDPIAAAQTVASWASDPNPLDCRIANRLLGRAFQHVERRQAQVRDIRAGTRRHSRGETHEERVARLKAEAAAAHAAENRQEAHP